MEKSETGKNEMITCELHKNLQNSVKYRIIQTKGFGEIRLPYLE
jgi:hypothetical protein